MLIKSIQIEAIILTTLSIRNLTKKYGHFAALENFSLEIELRRIYGSAWTFRVW